MEGSNMGGIGSAGQSSSSAEGPLAQEQQRILEQRQRDYENHYKKYIIQGLKQTDNDVAITSNMAQQTTGINQNYNQAKQNFSQSMAQRGLGGTGVEAQGFSALQNTRSQNLANAYYTAQQQNKDEKMNYLQLALQMSPSTTTAAPVLTKSGTTSMWDKWG